MACRLNFGCEFVVVTFILFCYSAYSFEIKNYKKISSPILSPRLKLRRNLAGTDDQDPVDKIFGFFFGKKEESPLGLKRFNKETFPDQFPATLTEFAAPVSGDSKEVALFRPLLKQTDIEKRSLKLVYDANKNGWSPREFHKAVDRKGPGVIFAKTKGGAIIGGYNPKGWVGYAEYRPGISAFLFTWPDGDVSKKATKLRKVGGAGLAVIDKPEQGPMFGSDGLCVPMVPKDERVCRCNLGPYYERMPGGGKSLFSPGEGQKTQLLELRAYVGVYAAGEEIPFNDAIPFSLT